MIWDGLELGVQWLLAIALATYQVFWKCFPVRRDSS